MGNSFPVDIRVFEHSTHHFECDKVITSSSHYRVFSESSLLFIEFYRIPISFFDFCAFSLIFIDFTVIFRKSFGHVGGIERSKWVRGVLKRFWNTEKWNLRAKIRRSCGVEVLSSPNTRRDRSFWKFCSCVKKTLPKQVQKAHEKKMKLYFFSSNKLCPTMVSAVFSRRKCDPVMLAG